MYIRNFTNNIANYLIMCYNKNMNDRFDLRTTHNDVRFRYAKGKSSYEGNERHPYHEILFITDGGGRFKSEHFDMLLT